MEKKTEKKKKSDKKLKKTVKFCLFVPIPFPSLQISVFTDNFMLPPPTTAKRKNDHEP